MKHGEKITFEFFARMREFLSDRLFYQGGIEIINPKENLMNLLDEFESNEKPTGPHLAKRFGKDGKLPDPETLKKIQHIADYYNGFDVPEYEFWDDESGIKRISNLTLLEPYEIMAFRSKDKIWYENCRELTKPAFNTWQGQITDEMCRIGNPMGGRLWVCLMTDAPAPFKLYAIEGDEAIIKNIGTRPVKTIYLADPETLKSSGIDPLEAGVKEIV